MPDAVITEILGPVALELVNLFRDRLAVSEDLEKAIRLIKGPFASTSQRSQQYQPARDTDIQSSAYAPRRPTSGRSPGRTDHQRQGSERSRLLHARFEEVEQGQSQPDATKR